MSDFNHVFDLGNLRRAYRWTLSNPDPLYKSYFRDSYDAFALASDTHLRRIRQEGRQERYQVSHASKLLIPKPSGTLRPITLLTVEDQIVYQACINPIAELIKQKTYRRYDRRVFAHLYAGKTSEFFYKRWLYSYRRFGGKIREAHASGYLYIADFDLTAFYDSIDHNVLRHFLTAIGTDEDMVEFLLDCLKLWTSSTWSNSAANIYHGHGIPQGPLPSGMLSEAVLMHLDEGGEQGGKTIYLRYVDDIKILARTEDELRRKLIKLDILSKEIGLFPQTSKINIRKIENPDVEVKSVSRPPERAVSPAVDQDAVVSRVLALSRNGRVESANGSRFKYVVAHAKPTYRLNERLMRVLSNHPEFAPTICSYVQKYDRVPLKLAQRLSQYIAGPELYHSVHGAILRACMGRMPGPEEGRVASFCANRLLRPKKGSLPVQPSYKEALIAWALVTRQLTYIELESVIITERDWWVRKSALRELEINAFGPASYSILINKCLRIAESETARIAANRLLLDNVKLTRPYGDVEDTAKRTLKAAGVIKRVSQPNSRINEILSYILKRKSTTYDWRTFFGSGHRHAELMNIFLKRNRESNIDAFLVQLDSYCDLVTAAVFSRVFPTQKYTGFGAAINNAKLIAVLPNAMHAFRQLHALRLQSTTAHPRTKNTGSPTRRLKHKEFYSIRPALAAAFDEIERNIAP